MIVLLTYYLILLIYAVIVIIIPAIGFVGMMNQQKKADGKQNVTIIVPFRNEVKALKQLCKSINRLNYPRDCFQVIFVDDNSSDNSLSILEELEKEVDFDIIQNAEHLGKKASILEGTSTAKFDLILTTDADCELPRNLLQQLQPNEDVSVGVALKTADDWNIISNAQEVESLMLAGITLGAANMEIPMLASGANLAYKKSIIEDTKPYDKNMHINSGDDMFLLKAALSYDYKVTARGGKPVTTSCEDSWDAYIDQSVRWSGKNNDVGLPQATLASWLVLLANVLLPLSLITHFSSGWIILLIKFVVDFLFLFLTAVYYERVRALVFAPVVFWFYPIHLVRVVIKIFNSRRKKE